MTVVVEQLQSLSKPERFAVLESVVVAEFKAALLMTDHEELPLDDSPTVEQLMDRLTTDVLADLFDARQP